MSAPGPEIEVPTAPGTVPRLLLAVVEPLAPGVQATAGGHVVRRLAEPADLEAAGWRRMDAEERSWRSLAQRLHAELGAAERALRLALVKWDRFDGESFGKLRHTVELVVRMMKEMSGGNPVLDVLVAVERLLNVQEDKWDASGAAHLRALRALRRAEAKLWKPS